MAVAGKINTSFILFPLPASYVKCITTISYKERSYTLRFCVSPLDPEMGDPFRTKLHRDVALFLSTRYLYNIAISNWTGPFHFCKAPSRAAMYLFFLSEIRCCNAIIKCRLALIQKRRELFICSLTERPRGVTSFHSLADCQSIKWQPSSLNCSQLFQVILFLFVFYFLFLNLLFFILFCLFEQGSNWTDPIETRASLQRFKQTNGSSLSTECDD